MQKKSLETILYSSAGIVVMLALVVAVNVITGVKPVRVDMTQEKAYTLSDGTRAMLQETGYAGENPFLLHAKRDRHAGNRLSEKLRAQGRRLVAGIQTGRRQKSGHRKIRSAAGLGRGGFGPARRLGAAAIAGRRRILSRPRRVAGGRSAWPFRSFDPDRERQLEYDITRAISQVFTPEKPTVGVMSALPVFGADGQSDDDANGPASAARRPWTFIEQLKQDFNVKQIEMTADKIDDDVKVLLVIHPKDISDKAQFAIDQFVLRGGKLIAFLDPQSAMASRQQNPMMGGEMGGGSSSLDKLLKAWGFNSTPAKSSRI